jgi:peptidoglycan/xylan/chitin deacetylase (PgdA/CDA1 family)
MQPISRPPHRPARSLRDSSEPPHRGRIQRLIEAAERFGVVRALRTLHDWGQPALTVLAYHRVMPTDALESYPFDPELISATPRQFEWQMTYLRQHMTPVSLEQVLAHLDGRAKLPPAAVAVTFDDGFADTYRYAFPILKRHGIPATIFLATGYIESGEPFWFELAAFLAFRVDRGALQVEGVEQAFPTGESFAERTASLRQLHELLKGLTNARRTQTITNWRQRFAALIEHGALGHSQPLSWNQVLEMAAAGIAFGSHTVTHPNLTQLPDEELAWELSESKQVLEQRLQQPIDLLAYPIGTASAFDARVIAAAERTGYRLGTTYVAGANPLDGLRRFELHRHGVGLGTSHRYFRALTSLPAWLE